MRTKVGWRHVGVKEGFLLRGRIVESAGGGIDSQVGRYCFSPDSFFNPEGLLPPAGVSIPKPEAEPTREPRCPIQTVELLSHPRKVRKRWLGVGRVQPKAAPPRAKGIGYPAKQDRKVIVTC